MTYACRADPHILCSNVCAFLQWQLIKLSKNNIFSYSSRYINGVEVLKKVFRIFSQLVQTMRNFTNIYLDQKKNQFTPTASDLFCLMRTFKMSSPIYPFHRNYIINQLQGPNYLITKNVHLFNGGPSNQPVSSRQVKPAPSRYYRHGNLHNVNTNYIISRCLLLWMMSVSL